MQSRCRSLGAPVNFNKLKRFCTYLVPLEKEKSAQLPHHAHSSTTACCNCCIKLCCDWIICYIYKPISGNMRITLRGEYYSSVSLKLVCVQMSQFHMHWEVPNLLSVHLSFYFHVSASSTFFVAASMKLQA